MLFKIFIQGVSVICGSLTSPRKAYAMITWKLKRVMQLLKIIWEQNHYDKRPLQKADKLVIVLIPGDIKIHGGLMSTYNVAANARMVCPDALVLVSTYPTDVTYVHNDYFLNDEKVWRWNLVMRNMKSVKELTIILGGPKLGTFCYDLTKSDWKRLKTIADLRIHVLNQRIDWMCERNEFAKLLDLTKKIGQTTSHKKFDTQSVCDQFGLPTAYLGIRTPYERYQRYDYSQREDLVVFSPDYHEGCEAIIKKIKDAFPKYSYVTIRDMKHTEYIDWISRAKFVITFGEGWDSYMMDPLVLGGVSFAVYNDEYFPKGHPWCNSAINIFKSYDEMTNKIVGLMKELAANREKYEAVGKSFLEHFPVEPLADYQSRVKRIFDRNFEFYPTPGCELKLSEAREDPKGLCKRLRTYIDSIVHPHLH